MPTYAMQVNLTKAPSLKLGLNVIKLDYDYAQFLGQNYFQVARNIHLYVFGKSHYFMEHQ